MLGVGLQTDQYRIDLGTTAGDYPVNDWVGGLQWRTNLGNGSLRLELARRMVNGSALSTTGAIDPLTGERWGGARRNGVSAVYYEALSPTLDFVGIARANLITGKNIPDNTEFNLQGIVGKTVYQRPGHRVESWRIPVPCGHLRKTCVFTLSVKVVITAHRLLAPCLSQ